nr:MAG TPA: hypothetical protein [Inoviridae sp.]
MKQLYKINILFPKYTRRAARAFYSFVLLQSRNRGLIIILKGR